MLFPWYIKYPNQNDEILNLDWILSTIDNLVKEVSDFVTLNTIKYADPIQWNITTQYEKNTVVIDPITGSAYISTQPVPSGVGLNNTDYWNVIFTLDVISANKNITLRDDANNILATFESKADDWLLWQGTLYIVTRAIEVGQSYVVGYNIDRYTVEMYLKSYIYNVVTTIGSLTDLTTTDKTSIVAALNELKDAIDTNTGDITDISTNIGDLDDLTTTDKDSLVDAINEVLSTLNSSIGDLDDLTTTDKDSLVDAINELVGDITSLEEAKNVYTSVSSMIDDTTLSVGDVVATLGYYTNGIGGAIYTISNTAGTAAISLNNGLYANIAINDEIHLSQLGAKEGDDISTILPTAISLINSRGIIHFDDSYYLHSTINVSISTNSGITIDGHEHTLFMDTNNSTIVITADAGSYGYNFNFRNLDCIGNNANVGIKYINYGSSLNRSEITNCNFSNFNNSILLDNARMFFFENIGVWSIPDGGIGLVLYAHDNGFCGDLELVNSQFNSANGNNGTAKEIEFLPTSGSSCAGIVIDSCDFYICDKCIVFSQNGDTGDLWIINSQFDDSSNNSISVGGSGQGHDWHIKDNYATGPKKFIEWYVPSGFFKSVQITGNYINGNLNTNPTININTGDKSSITISDNIFINCTRVSGAVVEVASIRDALITDNIFDIDTGSSTDRVVAIGNVINAIVTHNIAMNVSGTAYYVSATNKIASDNIPNSY